MRRAYRVSIDDAHVGRADDIRRRRRMRIDAFRCFKEAENKNVPFLHEMFGKSETFWQGFVTPRRTD